MSSNCKFYLELDIITYGNVAPKNVSFLSYTPTGNEIYVVSLIACPFHVLINNFLSSYRAAKQHRVCDRLAVVWHTSMEQGLAGQRALPWAFQAPIHLLLWGKASAFPCSSNSDLPSAPRRPRCGGRRNRIQVWPSPKTAFHGFCAWPVI